VFVFVFSRSAHSIPSFFPSLKSPHELVDALCVCFTPIPREPIHTLVPRLELNGSNWAAFSMRFLEAMDATDQLGHFDGTHPRLVPTTAGSLTAEELAAQRLWDHEDKIGWNLLL
jgi:hypothetical protein